MIHLAQNWPLEMAEDCSKAAHTIIVSALSFQPPRHPAQTPFGRLWQSWVDAAARGVEVNLFMAAPCKIHPATTLNRWGAQRAYDAKMVARFVPQPRLLHAKCCIVDTRIVWLGSGNMTAAAAHHNHELYARFESAEIAQRIQNMLDSIANPA